MLHSKRSQTPDSDERGREANPKFCIFHLRRRCLYGKRCLSIHFDDEDSVGEDDVRRRRSDDVRGRRSDDDGDDDEEEERVRRRGERSWRDEKRSHDYYRDEKRRCDDDRRRYDDDRRRDDDDRRRYDDDRRRDDDDRKRYDDDRRRDDDDRYYDRNSRRSSRSIDLTSEPQRSSIDDLERTSSERKEAQQSPNDAISETLSREQESKSVCVYFIRGLCKRGQNCKFAHPEPDLRAVVQRQIWLKYCKRYPHECDGSNCSYMHVTKEDELYYKQTGLINERILSYAIRKALQFDIPVKKNKSVCKNKLDGECTIFNCPFAHLTREEFIKAVLAEVKSEFEKCFGQSDRLFHSVEAQNAIIQALLNPHVHSVPPPPVLVPTMPAPSIVCPPVPALCGSFQPQAPSKYDVDQVLAEKLRLANEKIAEENERYMKYVESLEEENLQILRVLDPEQPAWNLDDIRKRILDLFEDINWNSCVKLFEKSCDYQHKKTSELSNLPRGQTQVMKPDSIGVPVMPQGTQPVIPQEMSPFNPSLGSLPPGLPVIPGTVPFNAMMGPAAPVVPIVPHVGPLVPSFPSVQSDSRLPVQDFKRGTVAHSKGTYNEDNYDSDPMEIVDDSANDMPTMEKRKVKQNTKHMSTSYGNIVPVNNGTSSNSSNVKKPSKIPDVDWAFKRHIQKVQEEGRKSSDYVPPKPIEDFETKQWSEESASISELDILQKINLKRTLDEHLQKVAPRDINSDPVPKKPRKADQCKLVLVNISDSHDEPSLFDYFEKFGKISKIDFGPYCIYLKFKDVTSVEEVLKKGTHHEINGYELQARRPRIIGGMSEDEALPDFRPRIIVEGLTEAHDRKSVEMYFSQFGKMTRILTKTDRVFITYADVSVAQQVIHQSEPHVINGELVAVKQEVYKKLMNSKEEEEVVLQDEQKLYVGGLDPTCKVDDLQNYFSAFGEIQVIDMKMNINGVCRGFGFVTFCDPKVIEYVLSIAHHEINGKPVIINIPKPHHKKPSLKLVGEPDLGVDMTENLMGNSSVEEVEDTEKLADELVLIQAQELGLTEDLEQEEEEDECDEKGIKQSKDVGEENLSGDYVSSKKNLDINNERTEPDEKVEPIAKSDRLYVGNLDKTFSDEDLWNYFSCFGKIRELDVKRNKKGLCRGFAFVTFCDSEASDIAVLKDYHEIKGVAIIVKYAEAHVKKGPRQEKQEEQGPLESKSTRSEVLDQPLQSSKLEEEQSKILEEEFDAYDREEHDIMEEQYENNMEKLYEYEENIFGIDTEIYDEGAS